MSYRNGLIASTLLIIVVIHCAGSRADIYRWDTGALVPGSEGIEPGPGVRLDQLNLEYAKLRSQNLTGASFFVTTLTNADFTGTSVIGINLTGTTQHGFTKREYRPAAEYPGTQLAATSARAFSSSHSAGLTRTPSSQAPIRPC
jgi:uncharacterized protein YjbI with pentapeptide repeats